jgi:hypothetical protein
VEVQLHLRHGADERVDHGVSLRVRTAGASARCEGGPAPSQNRRSPRSVSCP